MFKPKWRVAHGPKLSDGRPAYATLMNDDKVIADLRLVARTYDRRTAATLTHASDMLEALEELYAQLLQREDAVNGEWAGWRHAIEDILSSVKRQIMEVEQ